MFDLSKEKAELWDRYGRNTFGQDCLAARRMVEAGVPYIVINFPAAGIPTATTFPPCGANARNWTRALLCCCRTCTTTDCSKAPWFGVAASSAAPPRSIGSRLGTGGVILGNVFTALVAGGGLKGGHVVGASNAKAEDVKDRPVYPVDLLGSIYALGGIDASAKLPHPMGFEAHVLPAAAEGVKSAGLLTEIM